MSAINSSFDLVKQTLEKSTLQSATVSSMWQNFLEFAKQPLTILWACVALITMVALYDIYWSFKMQDVLVEYELNPIGVWLIELDGGDIALFMTVKTMGTMCVVFAIPAIFFYRQRIGLVVAIGVASAQALVFTFLNFGHIVTKL